MDKRAGPLFIRQCSGNSADFLGGFAHGKSAADYSAIHVAYISSTWREFLFCTENELQCRFFKSVACQFLLQIRMQADLRWIFYGTFDPILNCNMHFIPTDSAHTLTTYTLTTYSICTLVMYAPYTLEHILGMLPIFSYICCFLQAWSEPVRFSIGLWRARTVGALLMLH